MKLVTLFVVVSEGELKGCFEDIDDAEELVAEIHQDNIECIQDEYDTDEMSDEEIEFMAGYEGDNAYFDAIDVDMDDLDKMYSTSQDDRFSGREILELAEDILYDAYDEMID